jgi:hypothetical protein
VSERKPKSHGVIERRAPISRALCLEVKALTVKLLGTHPAPIAPYQKPQNYSPTDNSAKREETTIRIRTQQFRSGIPNFRNFTPPNRPPIFKPVRSGLVTIRHKMPRL